jgi:uncharacterized membrane protein
MVRIRVLALTSLLVLALSVGQAPCREQRRDPSTGRVRILYVGDPVPGSPYPIFTRDPLTEVVPVIAIGFVKPAWVIKRYMRLYMPRNEEGLFENYDMIIISDAGKQFFTDDHMVWFRNGVIDHGMALVMIGGFESFGGTTPAPGSWGDTSVQEVLPVDCITDGWEDKSGHLQVLEPDDPLMTSLPFDELGAFGIFHGCNIVNPRQASKTLAGYWATWTGKEHPLLVYWEVGQGSSFAMTADWTPYGGKDFLRWTHYGDYTLNLATYVTGGNLPDDLTLVYEARQLMSEFRNLRLTLDSLIEFAAKFGANMAPVEKMIGEAEETRTRGERSYIDAEMEECVDEFKAALTILGSASERAYELKDEAMLWVYVTEWLSVASTGMICGFILWTVMVRRRMYREISTTRLTKLK